MAPAVHTFGSARLRRVFLTERLWRCRQSVKRGVDFGQLLRHPRTDCQFDFLGIGVSAEIDWVRRILGQVTRLVLTGFLRINLFKSVQLFEQGNPPGKERSPKVEYFRTLTRGDSRENITLYRPSDHRRAEGGGGRDAHPRALSHARHQQRHLLPSGDPSSAGWTPR